MNTGEQRQQRLNEGTARGISIPQHFYRELDQAVPSAQVRQHSWHAHIWPRPSAATWGQDERYLPKAQAEWDRSQSFLKGQQERDAEREQQEAAAKKERDAADAAKRQQDAERLKNELRGRFLTLPGTTDQDFESAYPEL